MREWKSAKAWLYRELSRPDREWTTNAGTTSISCCSPRWTVRRRSATCFCSAPAAATNELEHEVRSLLAAHDRADAFLGAPAIDLAARQLAGRRSGDDTPGPAAIR